MYNHHRFSLVLSSQSRAVLLTLSAWVMLHMGVSASAQAATFIVDRTDDTTAATACDDETPNDCSLRGAILAANALSEASTISVPEGTYVLSQSSTCTYKSHGSPSFRTSSEVPLCVAKNVTIRVVPQ